MSLTLFDTDIVFVIPELNTEDIRQRYIYIIHSQHHGLLIKRIVIEGDRTITYSDNKVYKLFPLSVCN